jgi:hypothetical protein
MKMFTGREMVSQTSTSRVLKRCDRSSLTGAALLAVQRRPAGACRQLHGQDEARADASELQKKDLLLELSTYESAATAEEPINWP